MKAEDFRVCPTPPAMTGFYSTPLGAIRITFDENALHALRFEEHFSVSGSATYLNQAVFQETTRWLDLYFSGQRPNFLPLLASNTTPFRQLIYKILLTIPYGQTLTYGDVAMQAAKRLNRPTMSAQAVGNALAHNPILLIIPCHRVIGANGALTGYAGGLRRKTQLLAWEERWKKT